MDDAVERRRRMRNNIVRLVLLVMAIYIGFIIFSVRRGS
jgi:hypothetical protein